MAALPGIPFARGMIDDSDVFSIAIDPSHPEQNLRQRLQRNLSQRNRRRRLEIIEWRAQNLPTHPHHRGRPCAAGGLYAGTTSGLLKSVNGGVLWRQMSKLQINSIAFSPAIGLCSLPRKDRVFL